MRRGDEKVQRHVLVKMEKAAYLRVGFEENGERKRFRFSRVHGWRADLAYKLSNTAANDWDDDVVRASVSLNKLGIARDGLEARGYVSAIGGMRKLDLHYRFDRFLSDRDKDDRAWGCFYEE